MANNNSQLVNDINKYCIGGIIELQELLDGNEVEWKIGNQDSDYDGSKAPQFDAVKLKLEKLNYLENFKKIKEGRFEDYFISFNKDVRLASIQKLNYTDFIERQHNLEEVVVEQLNLLESNIIDGINSYIERNLDSPLYSRHLLNKIILEKLSLANQWLETNLTDPPENSIFPFSGGFNTFPQMGRMLQITCDKQTKFMNKIKNEFEYYYDKSEFEVYLESLSNDSLITHNNHYNKNHFTLNTKSQISDKKKKPNWLIVAEYLIGSDFTYEKKNGDTYKNFYLDNIKYKAASELARHLKTILNLKEESVRIVLSETFINDQEKPSNIFYPSHRKELKKLLSSHFNLEKKAYLLFNDRFSLMQEL